ncbi:MAG: Spo0E family sporulation regulatory protein-aspartic acid phosphatase [Halanaerobiales bacterium]
MKEEKVIKRINNVRFELHSMVNKNKGYVLSQRLVDKSQQLDRLILQYYKNK